MLNCWKNLCFSDILSAMEWTELQIRINRCGTVRCEQNWAWDSSPLSDFDLWYVWAGRGTLAWRDQTLPVAVGSLLCLQPGEAYHGRHDPAQRLGVTYMHFDFVDGHGRVVRPKSADRPQHVCQVREVDLVEQMLKRAVQRYESAEPLGRAEAELHVRATLLRMAAEQGNVVPRSAKRAHHDAMWTIARYIRENPGEIFSIDDLAERANYSTDHFARLFRQIVGQTPKEFCIRTRLQRAQTLLRESDLGIEQIAQTLGYADVFFFSRQFKQRVGQPPSAWRAHS